MIGFTLVGSHSRAELWHPDPTFLFSPGGGPLLDVGPYFVTQLVHLLGPVARVMGKTRIGAAQRHVTAPDRLVDVIDVTVPTHATAVLELASGAIGTYLHSFDVWNHRHPHIEIYGSLGTLTVPHPNWFGGDVEVQLNAETAARVVDPVAPPIPGEGMGRSSFRGYGVLDLIGAIGGAPHRTSATLAYHTLEVLEAIQRSSDSGRVGRGREPGGAARTADRGGACGPDRRRALIERGALAGRVNCATGEGCSCCWAFASNEPGRDRCRGRRPRHCR